MASYVLYSLSFHRNHGYMNFLDGLDISVEFLLDVSDKFLLDISDEMNDKMQLT